MESEVDADERVRITDIEVADLIAATAWDKIKGGKGIIAMGVDEQNSISAVVVLMKNRFKERAFSGTRTSQHQNVLTQLVR